LQTFVSYTYDNGETWTKPEMIAPYANGMSLRKGIKMSNGGYRRFKFHPTHHESDRGRYVYHVEINEQLDEHNRIITAIIENIYNLLLIPF
jgi:hypothetical protein